MTKPKSVLTQDGARAAIVAAVILVACGVAAICVESWKPAAIGGLVAFGALWIGQVWGTARGE